MDETAAPGAGTPRRTFLTLLALAPAAAACAGAGAARAPRPEGPEADPGPAGPQGEAPAAADPLAAIRAFPLAAGSEPAFVFRAAPARPGI